PQPHVYNQGNTQITVESLQTSSDHNFVEYFKKVPNSDYLYAFRVVKLAPAFTIDITMKVQKTHKVMYKAENINGCEFLNNPLMSKVFDAAYKQMVVNGSFFKCPIKPKVYYLKYEGMIPVPGFHPAGRFQILIRVKMSESRHPFVMEMLLKYKVDRL
ncbi:hypothetical protein KR032_008103, partial [Drosophila birchii]